MLEPSAIMAFIGASFLLIISPGPDIIFVITQGLTNSKKAGVLTATGLALGNFVHTLGAVFGVSIIFQTSPIAFNALKTVGAIYLFFLAYKAIKHRNDSIDLKAGKHVEESSLQLVLKGFIMNVLNPKVALFFLAFFPQFVVRSAGQIHLQMLVLGSIFVIMVAIVFISFGLTSGYFAGKILKNKQLSSRLNVISAIVFICIGIYLFFSKF